SFSSDWSWSPSWRSSALSGASNVSAIRSGSGVPGAGRRHRAAPITGTGRAAAPEPSVGVLRVQQPNRREEQDLQVEHERPVLDVIEVEFGAHADLFIRIHLATPAIDLRPAGDAGLDAVAGEVSVHDLRIEKVVRLRRDRMRARSHQRQAAHERVEELRQLIDRRLADEAADAGHARIVPGHGFLRRRVGLVRIHGAELVDLDLLIVEAVALLLEEDGSLAVQ